MTNTKPIWQPSADRIKHSQLTQFSQAVSQQEGIDVSQYQSLHQWSIDNIDKFWEHVWNFTEITASKPYKHVTKNKEQFPGANWFVGSRLNFAENLLRFRDDRLALIGLQENGVRTELTYSQLHTQVSQLASALRAQGVKSGDRVAGIMPNICETVIAMLACCSIGAIWSSCSPDFGVNGACDRFEQIQPSVLFCTDGYYYNGKHIDCLEKVKQVQARIPSIEKTVVVAMTSKHPNIDELIQSENYTDFIDTTLLKATPDAIPELKFEQLPFDHPVYINYSSGTTGAPKCIVHGAGGTLLQHKKELILHTDITRDDTLFYFTTCGWMMWNWLVSGLACGCTVVLYDGSPFANDGDVLLNAIENEKITVFGTSAKYISSLESTGKKPKESHDLSSLKTILSTGSPLSANSYDFIYRDMKNDVCLSSICGGTDIISCFILGNPNLPVYRGEIQCIGLGMAVEMWDDEGQALAHEKGQLVCVKPFPSTPLGFWNDDQDEKFHAAYFNDFPNIWSHGDYGEITPRHGIIIHGRSDAVLNPGGVRIGTAEIYRQVEKVEAVMDSVVIGQEYEDDVRVILFVVLKEGQQLDDTLSADIKLTIRKNTTPRHVPAKIIQVPDIPRTLSGKIVELAVKNIVHNRPVKNTDSLANPEALDLFKDLPQLA